MKKSVLALVITLLAFSNTGYAADTTFRDLKPDNWAYQDVTNLSKSGVI